ncbi:hypothetical protein ACA910_002024 [Epithemia clementina (nom. ined.)]
MRFHSTATALQTLAAFGTISSPLSSAAFGGLAAQPQQPSRSSLLGRLDYSPSRHSRPKFWSRLFSSSSSSSSDSTMSKKDQTFPTWSFDGPCTSMEWSSLLDIEMGVSATDSVDKLLEADLILVGVMAPAKSDDEKESEESDDEDDDKKEEEPVPLTGLTQALEEALGGNGILTGIIAENNKAFKNGAKAGSTTPVTRLVMAGGKAKRVVFIGLGATPKPEDDDDDKKKKTKKAPLEGVGATVGKALASQCQSQKKVESCVVLLPEAFLTAYASEETALSQMVQDWTATFYHTLYADNRYKSPKKVKKVAEDLKTVQVLVESSSASLDPLKQAMTKGHQLAKGIILTKDIVNAPHNVLNSVSLADTARRIAAESENGCITCKILNKNECEERGMGAYLGVARGSETEPQFIHLTYTPPGSSSSSSSSDTLKKVAVVGKGLLFDTGGYNIKTQMMVAMKFDCGGAAAALGAARAIGYWQPTGVEVHFLVAACENMINAKAMVPSDILTASNGKTIEVLNTDAEGRLTLADALVYADKEVGAQRIIELSTLTGACMVSLGQKYAGVWTANDELAEEIEQISKVTGDKSWRMPLVDEYKEELESSLVADLKNIGGKYGGAITAALFLQHFVSSKKLFAHIDIAGPVWSDKTGATGYGSQLVVEWIRRQGLPKDE